ncbi:thioredoxin domain-containing protein 15 isoform X1 [Zootermopsis nevadensis]|uniref:Thioredoxin domain-containing protein 15 n=1 Tax=Zootermopsis nevadensis TaxID=136037 RepID=A0A067RC23_ZOONE|nr:thioredoxin domain-containing protein 15 isoform X1 [Zootermopsis nevadensis]KDR21307.1 Thioredoxin domain-containing protein 15 [Zootermopsis nevadensis]
MMPKSFNILCLLVAIQCTTYNEEGMATPNGEIASDETSNEVDSHLPSADVEDVSVNKFIDELHKQFEEEQQVKIAKESLEATSEDGTLGDVLLQTTAHGEQQPFPVTSLQQEGGNLTTNATNLPDVSCTVGREAVGQPVELVNSTRLLNLLVTEPNVTNRRSTADCVALLFYARYCPFSSMAAPHFNALSRAFPDIKMAAVDAMKHHSFNTQYGIVGVPTMMLFHNGRPAAKFNDSEYTLEMFSRFITKYTGIEPQGKLFVTSADFGGPVPSVLVKENDYCLALSWIFILVCGIYFFSKSTCWRWIVETVQNTWTEAEAQHEHVE